MKGKPITKMQLRLYRKYREEGDTQKIAAAKSNVSLRSAKRMEQKDKMQEPKIISKSVKR